MAPFIAIDYINAAGNIMEHLYQAGAKRTKCGVRLMANTQAPVGNGRCRRCYPDSDGSPIRA